MPVHDRVPDRVDAAVHAVQPPSREPPLDATAIDAQREHLSTADNAVLPAGQIREFSVGWGCSCTHTVH
jgi:hypothetical protein